jgi:Periplasmic copper-binding protein (NosD)
MVAALSGAGLPAAARSARPAPPARTAAAADSTDLYVDNASGANCSDSGSGTGAQPFCTIAAAAAAVQPGDTVMVEAGTYAGATISVSGTSSAPITVSAVNAPDHEVQVQGGLVVSGVSNVVISGFNVAATPQPFLIENSSDVTIKGGSAVGTSTTLAAVQVTGMSSDVMIDGVAVTGQSTGVEIDSGVTGAVIVSNTIIADPGPGVLVTGAPGTDVVSNTMSYCNLGVELTGGSTGSYVENNIAEFGLVPITTTTGCAAVSDSAAFSVSSDSTSQTVANYNLIDPVSTGPDDVAPLYAWGGTSYTSLASFTAATGQGADDIAADPDLDSESYQNGPLDLGAFFFYPGQLSPAIDSADAEAPGEQPVDQLGNPRADDPLVTNSGTGPGYYDRGAIEEEDASSYGSVTVQPDPSAGPLAVTASAAPVVSAWPTNGPLGSDEYIFNDSSQPVVTNGTSSVTHVFALAGVGGVNVYQSVNGLPGWAAETGGGLALGADYTPVTPMRIMDTRSGIGVAKGAIAPGAHLALNLPAVDGISASALSGVAINVTVTDPTAAGYLTVFNQPQRGVSSSDVDFTRGQTLANLVTIEPVDGAISFQNNSQGTIQVVADLDGYYSGAGSAFQGLTPVRVLDTRSKIGTTASGPVAANGTVKLNLSGEVPAGATAAVLNLTVTQPEQAGFITAYADGQPVPNTSNLNFVAGQTVPNQVIVPLSGDVADFYNHSSGTVQLVADLDGYYASGAPSSFEPYEPTRIIDTRLGGLKPVAAHGTLVITPLTASSETPSDFLLNVTVTGATAAGVLTVYPDTGSPPGTSSVNFAAGQTVANLVTVQTTNGQVAIYNNSNGTVEIIVDEEGYFIDES